MKEWLYDQVYHFNFFTVITVIAISTILAKQNTNKEISNLTSHIYEQVEELKDEIRECKK